MKEYKINIDENFLRVLGPQMYTNIYYVLGEIIANSYDADATNIFLNIDTNLNLISIEDDGHGMDHKDVNEKFLKVAIESRSSVKDAKTKKGRFKLGRKGIGKLAILSISNSAKIMTIKNNDLNGFILSTKLEDSKILKPLLEEEIKFLIPNKTNGTRVEMDNILIEIPKQIKTIKKNLLQILPVFSEDFVLHVTLDGKSEILNSSDFIDWKEFATFIKINYYLPSFEKNDLKFINYKESITKKIEIKDKGGTKQIKKLEINGWIGTKKTTKNSKKELLDFNENHISIYSNGKMGMFNILPRISKNRIYENYVAGRINVDIFEDSDLIDIALSNREGYQTNDIRFIETEKIIRNLLDEVVDLHIKFIKEQNSAKDLMKLEKLKEEENKLKNFYNSYLEKTSNEIIEKVEKNEGKITKEDIQQSVSFDFSNFLSLKSNIESSKRRILICHSSEDKEISNFIYALLKYNGLYVETIIYSSAEDDGAKLPLNIDIFDYLRDFFVKSILNSNMIVIYIFSENLTKSWNASTEVGAGWIAKTSDLILAINTQPIKPLNNSKLWFDINFKEGLINMTNNQIEEFLRHIEGILNTLDIEPNSRDSNIAWIKKNDIVNII